MHLRARWYQPETGTFLSVDPVESEPPYQYVRGNPINRIDPSGKQEPPGLCPIIISDCDWLTGGIDELVKLLTGELSKDPYYQIFKAIETSKRTQDNDGFIFGFAGSGSIIWLNSSAHSLQELINWDLAFNNTCLPDTGETRGIEVVFDFKHQERGVFKYEGDVLNIGTIANVGIVEYAGKTRGFANASYEDGVEAYKGYFVSSSLSVGVSPFGVVGGGGTYIEAVPLEVDKTINPTGVFATYYGMSGGASAGIPTPVSGNAEVAVTWYDFVKGSRQKYAAPNWNKKDLVVRTSAAMQMMSEMLMVAKINPIGQAMLPLALIEMGRFINDRS